MAYNPDTGHDEPDQNPDSQSQSSPWQVPTQDPNNPRAQVQTVGASSPNAFNYENARDEWMSGKYSKDEAGARQWANDHGVQYNGGDTITLPNGGGSIDILGNWAGGKGNGQAVTQNWTPAGGNGPNPNGQPVGGGPGGPGGAGGRDPATQAKWDELYAELLKRSHQGLNIDRNDPIIRQQSDAFAANQERSRREFLSAQAEKSSPYSTGNQLGQERMSAERAGQATGGFEAQLMGRELQSRRDEIQHALDSMGGMLTESQRLQLQKELGYLNDATNRYGISTQAQTASDRLGFDIGNSDMNYYLRTNNL